MCHLWLVSRQHVTDTNYLVHYGVLLLCNKGTLRHCELSRTMLLMITLCWMSFCHSVLNDSPVYWLFIFFWLWQLSLRLAIFKFLTFFTTLVIFKSKVKHFWGCKSHLACQQKQTEHSYREWQLFKLAWRYWQVTPAHLSPVVPDALGQGVEVGHHRGVQVLRDHLEHNLSPIKKLNKNVPATSCCPAKSLISFSINLKALVAVNW